MLLAIRQLLVDRGSFVEGNDTVSDSATALLSPRLQMLHNALEAEGSAVLATFWEEIAVIGAPLVEPIANDATHCLVTFLWRATSETQCVSVRLNLSTGAPLDPAAKNAPMAPASFLPGTGTDPQASDSMTLFPGTDLWFFSWRFPRDLRTRYWFLVDDAPPQADSFNPHFIVVPKREDDASAGAAITSILALPAAPVQPWSEHLPDVPTGKVQRHRITSTILGNERYIWVYSPPGYDSAHAPYPLLILFDGWELMQIPPTTTFLDTMHAAGILPPIVAVMIDSIDSDTRTREDCCYPPFRDFLIDELLPWIHQQYQITDDPAQVTIGGVSLGGLAATYAGLERPDTFGNVLSLSGSFYWKPPHDTEHEWIARQFRDKPPLPLRFYLSVGAYETFFRGADAPSLLVANRHLRDVLQARGYDIHYSEYAGGHDYVCWEGAMADGLLALIGN